MTDKLISDLSPIGAAIADNTATEVQRNGQTTTEQALGSDWKTYIQSWLTKAMVGLGNVANSLQLTAANNLSDLASVVTARANLGYNQPVRMGYVNGQWQFADFCVFGSGSVVGASTMRLTPFYVRQACHITDIGVNVATGNAGDNVQFALYAADAVTGKPTGAALSSTPNVSVTSTGRVSGTLSAPVAVTPGLYWIGIQCSSGTPALTSMSSNGTPFTLDIGDTTLANLWPLSTTVNTGYSVTGQTYGTWPSLTSASFAGNLAMVAAYKVSVP